MKKIIMIANLYFGVPFLLLYMFLFNDELNYIENGLCIILFSTLCLTGLNLFRDDFSKKSYLKAYNTICTILEVFENFFYIIFFIGIFYCLGINLIPKIGR
ncbi:MAG: hypothetical protein IKF97_02015 [Clostridia bacterium]|nr:hypothetical protein [Clostridia bacterium]